MYGKSGISGMNSNGTVRPGGKFSKENVIPSEVLSFLSEFPKISVPFVHLITSARLLPRGQQRPRWQPQVLNPFVFHREENAIPFVQNKIKKSIQMVKLVMIS